MSRDAPIRISTGPSINYSRPSTGSAAVETGESQVPAVLFFSASRLSRYAQLVYVSLVGWLPGHGFGPRCCFLSGAGRIRTPTGHGFSEPNHHPEWNHVPLRRFPADGLVPQEEVASHPVPARIGRAWLRRP